jgi:hypothetical protein
MAIETPPMPAWMKVYMKTGDELQKQLTRTVIDNSSVWSPSEVAGMSQDAYYRAENYENDVE